MATERKFKDKKEYSRWYYQNYGKYGKKKGRDKSKYPLRFNNNNRPRLTEYYPNHPGMVSNDEAQRQAHNDRLRSQASARQRKQYAYARAAQGLASRMIRQNPVTASSSIAAHTIAGGVAAGYNAVKKSAFGKDVSSVTKKAKKKGRKIYNRIRKLF